MSEEQPIEPPLREATNDEPAPAVDAPEAQPVAETARSEPPPPDPRRRLRELLAIPDHQRTDAIWDEIIELEICLAPGNRIQGIGGGPGSPPEQGRRQGQGQGQSQGQGQGQGRRPEQARRQPDATPGAKPAKRFFKKPKRPQGSPPKP